MPKRICRTREMKRLGIFAKVKAVALFSGTIHFVAVAFKTGKVCVSSSDLAVAIQYATRAAPVISRYCSQYGPNTINIDQNTIPFSVDLKGGNKYNDATLQGWVKSIAQQRNLPSTDALVFLNPPGVMNTDADPSKGVLGYHGIASNPYSFSNVLGSGLTVDDRADIYALALSHEVSEMTVDPGADLSNPEVSDECVPGDEIILGDNKPMAQYAYRDVVVGASGIQQVTHKFVRPYNGDLIELKALGMLPMRFTPNHPIQVVHGRDKKLAVSYDSVAWKPAGNIEPKIRFQDGDYVVMPRIQGSIGFTEVSLKPYVKAHQASLKQFGQGAKPYSYRHPKAFPLNENTAWILGLYAAEGSVNPAHGSVEFSLNDTETNTIERLKKIFDGLGHKAWVSKIQGEKGVEVHVSSIIYVYFFSDVCGHEASTKKIPDFILYHKDERILRSFLKGYVSGDGSVKKTCTGYEVTFFYTVSKTLALQLQLAYGRLGIFISLHHARPARDGHICGRKVHMKDTYVGCWCSDQRAIRNKRLHGDVFYLPVKSISKIQYSGLVHNLETQDHTYLVSNIITHNCAENCGIDYRNFFDSKGNWLNGSSFPPSFSYAFFIDGIVKPSNSSDCPAPVSACSYPPPG